METYFLMGKTSTDAIKTMSADRTAKAIKLIRDLGGKIASMHACLGGIDYVLVVNFPSTQIAMKASIGLSLMTGIAFTTYPAITLDDFDTMMGSALKQ